MPKNRKQSRGRGRSRRSRYNDNVITFNGRAGFMSDATATVSSYWMTPNANFTSTWLGWTITKPGIFGDNANQLAHVYKEFRITKLRFHLLPSTHFCVCAYTGSVGYVTTTTSFPNIMQYPCVAVSSTTQTTNVMLNVPRRVLSTGLAPWYSTEDNPGTSVTNPASDPNLSSHGLMILYLPGGANDPFVVDFTIQFRNPEDPNQISPSPLALVMKMSPDELATLKALHVAFTTAARSSSPARARVVEVDDSDSPTTSSSLTVLQKLLSGLTISQESSVQRK